MASDTQTPTSTDFLTAYAQYKDYVRDRVAALHSFQSWVEQTTGQQFNEPLPSKDCMWVEINLQ